MPALSILLPVRNDSALLYATLTSMLAQTATDWELIVLDDASSDGSGALVERFASDDTRIRLIRRAENGGVTHVLNQGLKAAQGRYIAFARPGDLWEPEKLALQLEFLQGTQAALCIHNWRATGAARWHSAPLRINFEMLLRYNPVRLGTVLLDFDRTGAFQFRDDVGTSYALALWLGLAKAGHDIVLLPQGLAQLHPRRISGMFHRLHDVYQLMREQQHLRIRPALRNMITHALYGLWQRVF